MLATLARASIDGAVFASLVWAVTRVLPRLSPGARAFLWWCAAAKFVAALVWTTPVPLPVLPAEPAPLMTNAAVRPLPAADSFPAPTPGALRSWFTWRPRSESSGWLPPLGGSPVRNGSTALVAVWLAGVFVALALAARRWLDVRAQIVASRDAPEELQEMARDVASRLGLRRAPRVRLSDTIGTPLVAGLARPVIVLPARPFHRLAAGRQRMTICHELAHVRRGDLWLGVVAAMAERAFFFHPLARGAAREYVFWREAACDALVLDTLGASPHEYGRLLLDFGVFAPRRTLTAAGAAWSFANLKRRIVMLRPPARPSPASRALTASALALATAGIVPVTLAARPGAPLVTPPAPAVNAATRFAEAWPDAPAPPDSVIRHDPAIQEKPSEQLAFVMFTSDGGATVSASADDMTRARQLHRGEPMLWVRHRGIEYVIRDDETMQELRRIWRPVDDIGNRRAAAGELQSELGARQGGLAAAQAQLAAEEAARSARQADADVRQAELARLRTELERLEAERVERARRELARSIERQLAEQKLVSEQLREMEEPMRELRERLTAMAEEMEVFRRRMDEASNRAQEETRVLIERALARGLGEIVR
jgi:beta-lactamase regulating signal transducer with metallopeptidase domain